jgi:hypothetical protein
MALKQPIGLGCQTTQRETTFSKQEIQELWPKQLCLKGEASSQQQSPIFSGRLFLPPIVRHAGNMNTVHILAKADQTLQKHQQDQEILNDLETGWIRFNRRTCSFRHLRSNSKRARLLKGFVKSCLDWPLMRQVPVNMVHALLTKMLIYQIRLAWV